jgi:hypothetical protein
VDASGQRNSSARAQPSRIRCRFRDLSGGGNSRPIGLRHSRIDHALCWYDWPELASPGTCIQIVAAVMIGVGLHKASRAAVAVSADEACLPSADGGLGDPGQAAAAIGGGVAGAGPGGRKRTELEICARAPHRRAVDIERSESALYG